MSRLDAACNKPVQVAGAINCKLRWAPAASVVVVVFAATFVAQQTYDMSKWGALHSLAFVAVKAARFCAFELCDHEAAPPSKTGANPAQDASINRSLPALQCPSPASSCCRPLEFGVKITIRVGHYVATSGPQSGSSFVCVTLAGFAICLCDCHAWAIQSHSVSSSCAVEFCLQAPS